MRWILIAAALSAFGADQPNTVGDPNYKLLREAQRTLKTLVGVHINVNLDGWVDRPVAYDGGVVAIVYAVCMNGDSPGHDFYLNELPKHKGQQDKLMALFQRMGDHGKIYNERKFKHLEGSAGFFEFKSGPVRMLCYFSTGRTLIVTHGFVKKGDKLPAEQLRRGERIRAEDSTLFCAGKKN